MSVNLNDIEAPKREFEEHIGESGFPEERKISPTGENLNVGRSYTGRELVEMGCLPPDWPLEGEGALLGVSTVTKVDHKERSVTFDSSLTGDKNLGGVRLSDVEGGVKENLS